MKACTVGLFVVLVIIAQKHVEAGSELTLGSLSAGSGLIADEYQKQREAVLAAEEAMRFDHTQVLSDQEVVADRALKALVDKENAKLPYLPSINFFYTQEEVEATPLFAAMKTMPKGGILHLHSTSTLFSKTLIEIFVKHANECYTQFSGETFSKESKFSKFKCSRTDLGEGWHKLLDVRSAFGAEEFDKIWENQLDIKTVHGPIDHVWPTFQHSMDLQGQMILYRPVMEEYLAQTFEVLEKDNVLYAEFRHVFGFVYDLDKAYSPLEELGLLKDAVESYKKSRSTAFDARYVYCGMRRDDNSVVRKQIEDFLEMRNKYGDFIAAFDLVGQEDLGHSALYFAELFEEYKEKAKQRGLDFPLYLHDGETVMPGDQNVVDAILLGSKRIGHGYDLINHPALWDTVKKMNILVEVSPISNQVLKLVKDIRNHPGRALIAAGIPININSDDPGSFGYEGVSHDYYMVSAAWNLGLKSLKQLGLNAIEHSGKTSEQKLKSRIEFLKRWAVWVKTLADASA